MEIQSYMELDGAQQRGSSTVYLLSATCSGSTYTHTPHNQHSNPEYGAPLRAPCGETKTKQKTSAGQASTTYRHQPPCRPFTRSPNLKPELTPLQELPLNTTDALYTPLLASRPEDILSARAYTDLFHAPPLERVAHSPRGTYPAGCGSPWPGPATQSQPGPACAPQSFSHTPPTFTASCTGAPLASPTLLLSAP